MAKAAPEGLITALDIGTSKVSAMIAQKGDGGELIVLGTGQRESKGVKRGYIADMAATEVAVREAVEQAERIAGINIENVWAGFSAGGLVSDEAFIESELNGHRIEQADIDALLQEGRQSIDPQGRMVLHAQPALYTLDGLDGVKKPLGLHADRLGVHIHVIAADGSPVRNLDLCVRSAHLEVKSIIASPVATGFACLSQEERDLGVALVEIGAGRDAGRAEIDPDRIGRHHRRHRLRLRHDARAGGADEMLPRLRQRLPARQSRDDHDPHAGERG